jgi:putative transposase
MQNYQLKPVRKHQFVHATDSPHHLPIFENVLNCQFEQTVSNQAWIGDITYIRTLSGWLYLTTVLDLYAR